MMPAPLQSSIHEELAFARCVLPRLCTIDTSRGHEGLLLPELETLIDALDGNISLQPLPVDAVGDSGSRRANLLATWGRPRLLLSTHLDTVPPQPSLHETEEALWGPGSCDAKGQIVAQLATIRHLLRSGYRNIAWLGVVGEETTSDGAYAALDLAPLLPEVRTVINGEPTENRWVTGQKGYLHLALRCRGESGHSSGPAAAPDSGRHALWNLFQVLSALRDLPVREDSRFGTESWNLGRLQGGEAANVVPGEAEAEIVARTVPGSTLIEDLRSLLVSSALEPEFQASVEILLEEQPSELDVPPEFPGLPVAFGSVAPTLRALANGGQTMMFGPGSILVAHTDQEHLRWTDLAEGIDQLTSVCQRLLQEGSTDAV